MAARRISYQSSFGSVMVVLNEPLLIEAGATREEAVGITDRGRDQVTPTVLELAVPPSYGSSNSVVKHCC